MQPFESNISERRAIIALHLQFMVGSAQGDYEECQQAVRSEDMEEVKTKVSEAGNDDTQCGRWRKLTRVSQLNVF